jgi:hypothetical protein
LREQVLDGFENDVPGFVKELKRELPPAAAGLLAKLMPPPEIGDDVPQGGTVIVNILPIKSGTFVLADIEQAHSRVPRGLKLVVDRDADAGPIIDGDPAA